MYAHSPVKQWETRHLHLIRHQNELIILGKIIHPEYVSNTWYSLFFAIHAGSEG